MQLLTSFEITTLKENQIAPEPLLVRLFLTLFEVRDFLADFTLETVMGNKAGDTKSDRNSERGFASMPEEKQRQIASKGGKAAHEKGTAHEFDSAEAREAGQKGGRAVSADSSHMAQIGRKGGEASHAKSRSRSSPTKGNLSGDHLIKQADSENLPEELPQQKNKVKPVHKAS